MTKAVPRGVARSDVSKSVGGRSDKVLEVLGVHKVLGVHGVHKVLGVHEVLWVHGVTLKDLRRISICAGL